MAKSDGYNNKILIKKPIKGKMFTVKPKNRRALATVRKGDKIQKKLKIKRTKLEGHPRRTSS